MSKISNIEYYMLVVIWQMGKCNLLWEDSAVSTRSRRDRFQRYLLRALLYLYSHFDWIKDKEKERTFPSADRAAVQKESSARLEYSSMSACLSRSAFKKRGDRTGWRARWNLRLTRDARRMYSTCRRCQTVKRLRDMSDPCIASITSYADVIQISLKTLYEKNRPTPLYLRLITSFAIAISFCYHGNCWGRNVFRSFERHNELYNHTGLRRCETVTKNEDPLKCQTHLSKYL